MGKEADMSKITDADAVRSAVQKYLTQMAAAQSAGDDGAGYIEKGSYFSTLDNLPDFVSAELRVLRSKSEAVGVSDGAAEPFMYGIRYVATGKPFFEEYCIDANRAELEAAIEDDKGILEVVPLYTHPAPATVVSDAMVERFRKVFVAAVRDQDKEWTDDSDEGENLLTSPNGDWFAIDMPIRSALVAALTEEGA